MVLVERLAIVVRHEERRLQDFEQCFFANAGIGIVDEYARVGVAVCVDVQVASAAGDTAADKLAVVLEIHGEDRLFAANCAYAVIHFAALLGVRQQCGYGVVADRHVVEVPDEIGAPLNHLVDEFVIADGIEVLACVAAGKAERQVLFF